MSEEYQATGRPTPASQWKRPTPSTEVVVLPSGNEAKIRQPTLGRLVAEELFLGILEKLAGNIVDAAGGQPPGPDIVRQVGAYDDMLKLADRLCPVVFVSPRIVSEPKAEDEIALDWLSEEDRVFVMMHIMEGIENASSFLEISGIGGTAGPIEPPVPLPAE
jgi:hypothetical protein